MRPSKDPSKQDRGQKAFNAAMAAVAGQVGCLTILIILAALFGGLWLDNRFGSDRPIFTISLMILSVPVTLVAMFWVVRKTTARLLPANKQESSEDNQEDIDSGYP